MKRLLYSTLLLAFLSGYGCKKEDRIDLSGQLLLTQKFPMPLANRKLHVYQRGTSSGLGIPSSSTSSSAATATDAQGNFRFRFKPGTTTFLFFRSANSSPFSLRNASGDTAFPRFSRNNLAPSDLHSTQPVFVGKIIEKAIIKMQLFSNITIADTIGLEAYTLNGTLVREYTGLQAAAGSVITLDTITNMLFTDFDYGDKQFLNNLRAGRKRKTPSGYVTIAGSSVVPDRLPATDEANKEIIILFSK